MKPSALTIQQAGRTPGGVMVYDRLGINRVLPDGASRRDVELFVQHWLGPVLDYDNQRRTDLVTTLSTYLDHGGDLVATAAELSIHRSTLRYRLHRIAELSIRAPNGHDIGDTRNWPSLQVAIWAGQILTASLWEAPCHDHLEWQRLSDRNPAGNPPHRQGGRTSIARELRSGRGAIGGRRSRNGADRFRRRTSHDRAEWRQAGPVLSSFDTYGRRASDALRHTAELAVRHATTAAAMAGMLSCSHVPSPTIT